MSGAWTGRDLRGWLLPDDRVCSENLADNDASDTGSDYSQAGSRPGAAVPEDSLGTYLPRAHSAQSVSLALKAVRAGIPGVDDGAGLAYREDAEDETAWRGWNEPNLVTGFRSVITSTTGWDGGVSAVTCPRTQRIVVVATEDGDVLPPSAWVWDPETRDWGPRIDVDASVNGGIVCVWLQRATGRVLAARITADDGLAIYASDDDGATWYDYSPHAMPPDTLDASVTRLRAVEDRNGVILLLAGNTASDLWQYASADGGATFSYVDMDPDIRADPDVSLLPSGNLLFTYVTQTADVESRVLTDAYDPISEASTLQIYDGVAGVDARSCAATTDADGVTYLLLTIEDDADRMLVFRSFDEGGSWQEYDDSVLQVGAGMTIPVGDNYRRVEALAFSGGELVALMTTFVAGGWYSGALHSLVLGGWSTAEALEPAAGGGGRHRRGSWADSTAPDHSWVVLPELAFEDLGWTPSGDTEIAGTGEHRFAPTATTSYVSLVTPDHTAGDAALLLEPRVVSGGSLTTNACSFHHQRRTGATRYYLLLRFSTTGFVVRNGGTGVDLAEIEIDMTQKLQMLVLYGSLSTVTVLYKRYRSSVWEVAYEGALAGDPAVTIAFDLFELGCMTSTTSDFRLGLLAFTHRSFARGVEGTQSGIRELRWGKALPPIPYPVRDQDDGEDRALHLSGSGGVARYHEGWALPAAWDYAVEHLDTVRHPSPRRTWRSVSALAAQVLTWDLGANSRLGHADAIGLCLVRPNFRRAILEVSTAAAPDTFVQIGEYDAELVSGTFELSGDLLRPKSTTSRGRLYLGDGDLVHGGVTLDGGGDPVTRRVRENSGGGWLPSGMRLAAKIEGVDGTEPTSGAAQVWLSGGVLVVHQAAPTTYRRVRLRIPVQDVPDDYYELGGVVIGSIHAIGRQWSRGWSWRYAPLVRESEDDSGTTYVDPRGDEDNVLRRELTVSWQDGYGMAALREGSPDYLGAGPGLPPLVADMDVWQQVVGLLRATKGGALPSVALLSIPRTTGMILDPSQWCYGRLGVGQTAQFNNVQGKEGRSEIYRGESLTHVELK